MALISLQNLATSPVELNLYLFPNSNHSVESMKELTHPPRPYKLISRKNVIAWADSMATTTLNVNKQTVLELLCSGQETPFVIPEYQRPYSWGDDEISTLFDDLWNFSIALL